MQTQPAVQAEHRPVPVRVEGQATREGQRNRWVRRFEAIQAGSRTGTARPARKVRNGGTTRAIATRQGRGLQRPRNSHTTQSHTDSRPAWQRCRHHSQDSAGRRTEGKNVHLAGRGDRSRRVLRLRERITTAGAEGREQSRQRQHSAEDTGQEASERGQRHAAAGYLSFARTGTATPTERQQQSPYRVLEGGERLVQARRVHVHLSESTNNESGQRPIGSEDKTNHFAGDIEAHTGGSSR